MGWYGDIIKCPNCKKEKAAEIYRSNCQESYYLVCTCCGLHLFAEYKQWVITNSYIDSSVIGKNLEEISPEDMVDTHKNTNVIPKGSVL